MEITIILRIKKQIKGFLYKSEPFIQHKQTEKIQKFPVRAHDDN